MSSTSPTTVMAGIFAILFGLAAAYGVRVAMTPEPVPPAPAPVVTAPAPAPVAMHTVVLAKHNIAPFTCLTKEDLSEVQIPESVFQRLKAEATSADAFPFENLQAAVSRVTSIRIMAGNWITNECLYEFGKVPTLEDKLSKGELAMSIRVDEMSSVAGFLHPDARVNISWLPSEAVHPELPANVAVSIYKNVRVLATSSDMHEFNPGTPREIENITIAVTQPMANALSVLQQKGTFAIAMAASGEDVKMEEGCTQERATIYSVLGLDAPEEDLPGSATTDAWTGSSKKENSFGTSEVLEAHNATRVVMNGLKPLKKMPKRSQDPDTLVVE